MHRVLQRGAALAQHQIPATEVSWDDLRTFLACAQTLSFRKASLELGINNTTISRALDRLEEHLGQKLFIRHQSGLALTDEGIGLLDAPGHGGKRQLAVQVAGEEVDLGGPERVVVAAQPCDEVKCKIVPG